MRITWGTAILALAVAAGAYTVTTAPISAQGAALTQDQFPTAMKTVASTAQSARMKAMNNQLADAAKDAQTLATTFSNVEKFFASKNKADAVTLAQTGKTAATNAATALAAGDGAKAATELGAMQMTCKQCHSAYRDGGPQAGGYKFKEGSI